MSRSPRARVLACALLILAASCRDADLRDAPPPRPAPHADEAAKPPQSTASAVLLVTIDGVRWQEIFGGIDRALADRAKLPHGAAATSRELLPNLYRLFFDAGTVVGDPRLAGGIRASGPRFVSLPGYVEIMTGARSACRTNDCMPALDRTILDEVAAQRDWFDGSVAAFASWEIIGRAAATDRSRVVVRAGRDPKDEAPAYPGSGSYRPDRVTAVRAVDHLLRSRPRFMWTSLGDTDEWAHRGDYRGYLDALRSADAFVGELAAHLEDMGDYGARAVILVTADHGRDADFANHGGDASAAVWLLARGGPIPRQGAIATREMRYLRDVAPTIRQLIALPARACLQCGVPIEELLEARPNDERRAAAPH